MRRFFTFLLILTGLALRAQGVKDYYIGDVADADVTTPLALDVPDATATVALRAARAHDVPVVFRSFPVATNGLTVEFMEVFTGAQTNFLKALAANFHTPTVAAAVTGSPEFGNFLTDFNQHHAHFPVTSDLAAAWAQGGDGGDMRDRLLEKLLQISAGPLRPDDLPEGFVPGKLIRLVPVTAANQKLTLYEVQRAPYALGSTLLSVTQAQKAFSGAFPTAEQPCARAVARLLVPNCYPDELLTELVSGVAVSQLVVNEHYDAGDIILHRGDRVDAKARAALDSLNEKLAAGVVPTPVKKTASTNMAVATVAAPVKAAPAVAPSSSATAAPISARAAGRWSWLILVLAGVSVVASLFAWRQAVVNRRALPTARTLALGMGQAVAQLPAPSGPDLRDAVMQELALQRRELLISQQAAAEEIASLVKRLDEMRLPLQEREETYEARIKALENELEQRTAENRELLKLKLESVRKQLESERSLRTATGGTAG